MSRPDSMIRLQEWFAGAVMHPGGAAEGARLAPHAGLLHGAEGALTAGPRLSALERLAIYHDAYRSRLVECLADDYPALRYALGEEDFTSLCRAYIAAHPSRAPSLNAFGRHMSGFISRRGAVHAPFASELARLEWTIVERIHAAEAETVPPEVLAGVAPDRWASARFSPSEGLRILKCDYPVNRYFQSFRDGDNPAIPERASSATAVYRKNYVVWRMDLSPPMLAVLEALIAGATLEEALSAIEAHDGEDVAVWFRGWIGQGFFARIDFG